MKLWQLTLSFQIMSSILKSNSAMLRPPMYPFNEVKTGYDAPQFAKVIATTYLYFFNHLFRTKCKYIFACTEKR